jgi:hypothetical protein
MCWPLKKKQAIRPRAWPPPGIRDIRDKSFTDPKTGLTSNLNEDDRRLQVRIAGIGKRPITVAAAAREMAVGGPRTLVTLENGAVMVATPFMWDPVHAQTIRILEPRQNVCPPGLDGVPDLTPHDLGLTNRRDLPALRRRPQAWLGRLDAVVLQRWTVQDALQKMFDPARRTQ